MANPSETICMPGTLSWPFAKCSHARGGVVKHFAALRVDGNIVRQIEHRHVRRHGMHQRDRIGFIEAQRLHHRRGRQIRRRRAAAQAGPRCTGRLR